MTQTLLDTRIYTPKYKDMMTFFYHNMNYKMHQNTLYLRQLSCHTFMCFSYLSYSLKLQYPEMNFPGSGEY